MSSPGAKQVKTESPAVVDIKPENDDNAMMAENTEPSETRVTPAHALQQLETAGAHLQQMRSLLPNLFQPLANADSSVPAQTQFKAFSRNLQTSAAQVDIFCKEIESLRSALNVVNEVAPRAAK
ncbi:hypothetical protein CANCADRAFT_1220 [Tortispora caseinolytica NRRL Y-17796]|uniref:Mediator of RNA polymerase II transcription subunit 11 n=1 Tax=Tortispora caseinolytica NRRL Y-17796 TaxID=767744 RepID=A0A1E4TLL6_9ASCO|nr:hypothetical protein CANCADRAFT_1220 [Tortispora caseinolytica NRRL Y-17796]